MRVRVVLSSLVVMLGLSLALFYGLTPQRSGLLQRVLTALDEPGTVTVDITEYKPPRPAPNDDLVDDQLADKNPAFAPERVDRRPEGSWRINASAAVLRLDVPMLKPDVDAALLVLRPSYADAIAAVPAGMKVLPSINLVDGKAKQFDDGLVAAISLAYHNGLKSRLVSKVALIQRLLEHVKAEGAASSYLAAGLKLAGVDARAGQPDQVAGWISGFESNSMVAKPLGFYTWSDELTRVFRFMRFFQQPLPADRPELIDELAQALGSDPRLLEDYKQANAFRARLANPLDAAALDAVVAAGPGKPVSQAIAVFPGSRSKENDLFRQLFPNGVPPSADLMRALIRAIRSGTVDLAPRSGSGWYEYQIYALETFLLPEKGEEHAKLMLTKAYKKRMLEAFAALMTKRRETHSLMEPAAAAMLVTPPPARIKPRLRVEPGPSYYVRMARSYDFLLSFLLSALGEDGLSALHGLREEGERSKSVLEELRWMREFYYGLHLLSAEDIGMAPALRPDEPVDRTACESRATEWLDSYGSDADLKADTRVSVPLYFDVPGRRTRLWSTVGIRLAKLNVSYARPPKIRPDGETTKWQDAELNQLEDADYVIAVDEFAEADMPGLQPLTGKEFRDVCDTYKTRPEILDALSRRAP